MVNIIYPQMMSSQIQKDNDEGWGQSIAKIINAIKQKKIQDALEARENFENYMAATGIEDANVAIREYAKTESGRKDIALIRGISPKVLEEMYQERVGSIRKALFGENIDNIQENVNESDLTKALREVEFESRFGRELAKATPQMIDVPGVGKVPLRKAIESPHLTKLITERVETKEGKAIPSSVWNTQVIQEAAKEKEEAKKMEIDENVLKSVEKVNPVAREILKVFYGQKILKTEVVDILQASNKLSTEQQKIINDMSEKDKDKVIGYFKEIYDPKNAELKELMGVSTKATEIQKALEMAISAAKVSEKMPEKIKEKTTVIEKKVEKNKNIPTDVKKRSETMTMEEVQEMLKKLGNKK